MKNGDASPLTTDFAYTHHLRVFTPLAGVGPRDMFLGHAAARYVALTIPLEMLYSLFPGAA